MQPRGAEHLSEPDAGPNSSLDYRRFAATPLAPAPFDHLIVPGFLRPEACDVLDASFPEIGRGGSFPADALDCGPAFAAFLEELRGAALTRAVEDKFGIDLSGRPVMVTLRGRSRPKDGRIHTDSAAKLITALIYMNPSWDSPEGRDTHPGKYRSQKSNLQISLRNQQGFYLLIQW